MIQGSKYICNTCGIISVIASIQPTLPNVKCSCTPDGTVTLTRGTIKPSKPLPPTNSPITPAPVKSSGTIIVPPSSSPNKKETSLDQPSTGLVKPPSTSTLPPSESINQGSQNKPNPPVVSNVTEAAKQANSSKEGIGATPVDQQPPIK